VACDSYVHLNHGIPSDHHFHYGYLLHSSAILAKYNQTWALTYKPYLTDLIRDIANPVADSWFPSFRMFDFFVGHSWAGVSDRQMRILVFHEYDTGIVPR
jgi:endo-1,3(4)-beta-glucanase